MHATITFVPRQRDLFGESAERSALTTPEVDAAIKAHAPCFIDVSGGCDSQEPAHRTIEHLDAAGHRGQRYLIRAELADRAVGLDRGVVIPLMASDGKPYDLMACQRERIAKKQAAARRWQRRLSRRVKGSANRRKAVRRIEACRQYEKHVRRDFAHQASHAVVSDPKTLLIVFEALGVQRMSRRPKGKQDQNGRWQKNGARAKAGLNKSVLASAWGKTKEFASYKAHRAGKLVIEVPPHHSSQECSACGHTHPDNRPTQAEFVCQCCGHSDNADRNASRVVKMRGVRMILAGEYREKESKRTMRMAKKSSTTVGAGRSERGSATSQKPAETSVRRPDSNARAHGSGKPETPTYSQHG